MDKEIWKDVLQYDGKYQVSTKGNVRRKQHDGTYVRVATRLANDNNVKVTLSKGQGPTLERRIYAVKRIEMAAHSFNPDEKHKIYVICIDGDPTNLDINNLRYATPSEAKQLKNSKGQLTNQSRKVRCLITGIIYPSARVVEREYGMYRGQLDRIIRSGKTYKGHKFEYVTKKGKPLSKALFTIT